MDHHRQNHHHHQPRNHHHHHQQPRHQQQLHHIINSPPSSSSRYLPLHPHPHPPPPPPPLPPPPQFPENHPNFFPHHHHLHPHPHPNFHPHQKPLNEFPTFVNSPPHHHHFHHRDDHRDVIYRSPPSRVLPPSDNCLQFHDSHIPNLNPNRIDDVVLDHHHPRFQLNEIPPPPPPHPRVPPMSPVARRSPNQFVQFDRFGRRFEREDLNFERLPQHDDSIDFQLRRDRVDDEGRRILGVSDRLEGNWDHHNRDVDRLEGNWDHHNRDVDHREKFYPEMVMREEFEPNSSNSEYDRNDEGLFRGGRRDSGNVGFVENVNKRYGGGGGGGREVSRSPIKFRIGGVEGDDRFANRGRKEDVQEFNNRATPRKNVQKKSAFLRIQPGKPQHYTTSNFRNRFDNSTNSSSPHKGKESNLESVHDRISEERVGSPVELDVSFKSNALVAKAIMVAPSCSGVEVNVNNALSDSGTRIDSESPAKVATPKLKSVVSVREDKDPKKRVRVSPNPIKKRVGVPNTVEVRGSESSPGVCSTLSGGALRKVPAKGKVLVKVNKNAGSDKVSPPVMRKKRKTISQPSRLSSSPIPSSVNFVDNVHFDNHDLDLQCTQTNKQILLIMSTELPDGVVTGGQSAPIEMPKTPPLPCNGKTPDNDAVNSGELTFSLPVDHSEGKDNEEAMKAYDSPLSSWRDPESSAKRTLEDSGICSDGELQGSNSKRMVYINRKSNQLIAASKSSQLSVHNMGKTAASSSNKNYYKRRKYQLIRASSDGNIQQMVAVIKDNSKSDSQSALHPYSSASSTKRPSNKVKASKFSLVWKLGDSMSSGKGADALRSGRLLSHLLPWKRSTYWSRKLLSSRKRGAVYVRSGRGFSLRRSKVTSLPGTSLKWSKSMEKCSKKVEEEAAKTVAAVQQPGSSGISSKAASSLHSLHKVGHGLKLHPGERIFRIGVFRYRMDPSRRTLQRISDEEASDFTAPKTEKDARKTYVPKRLLIGSDEYVRIGNGNQLVRDPKRRTRILASEKVRWSLHTARMRLAKKRKFCQFFTRFGKCNKGEGKCPFIHDPSKLAVCTKFLNGLCSDTNCKLTHKVIPERMPDCSFYLQGLCSNEKCPYRHVNVNPKASICESFLRGYCAEGNECRKKHSYICPEFEASGSCPQGSKCKLYHPRKVKAKKRKVSSDQNKANGRYFGSDDDLSVVADPELRPMVEMPVEPSKDGFSIQEDLGDFISLDVGDNEALESGLTSEQTKDGPLDSQLDGIDEMIVPLSILGAL